MLTIRYFRSMNAEGVNLPFQLLVDDFKTKVTNKKYDLIKAMKQLDNFRERVDELEV